MAEKFDFPKENFFERRVSEAGTDEAMERFEVESGGQKFDFAELQSAEPTDTLVLHLPGFAEDAEQYAASMHGAMGEIFNTVALKGYGESYSREFLTEALRQVIQKSGKQNVVLHGDSFGAAIAYDLIGDPGARAFLENSNVVGAVLEVPFLDKDHLRTRARSIPDNILIRGGLLFDKVRKLNSIGPTRELVQLSHSQKKSMLQEALRKKTTEREIEIPIYIVFSQNESLSDNERIMDTLKGQAKKIASTVVASADDNGHHIADNTYESMWEKEKEAIEGFVKDAGSTSSENE